MQKQRSISLWKFQILFRGVWFTEYKKRENSKGKWSCSIALFNLLLKRVLFVFLYKTNSCSWVKNERIKYKHSGMNKQCHHHISDVHSMAPLVAKFERFFSQIGKIFSATQWEHTKNMKIMKINAQQSLVRWISLSLYDNNKFMCVIQKMLLLWRFD